MYWYFIPTEDFHWIMNVIKIQTSLPTHFLPVSSSTKPVGHSHRNDPSVLMQSPPMQALGMKVHSLRSSPVSPRPAPCGHSLLNSATEIRTRRTNQLLLLFSGGRRIWVWSTYWIKGMKSMLYLVWASTRQGSLTPEKWGWKSNRKWCLLTDWTYSLFTSRSSGLWCCVVLW